MPTVTSCHRTWNRLLTVCMVDAALLYVAYTSPLCLCNRASALKAGTKQASSGEVFLLPCLQFVNTIRSYLPATSNVLVAITRITASSVTVESSVTFLDGDTSAASSFANTLQSSPNSIFPASTYGAVQVTGTVSTQSVVGETCRQPSCIACTCLVEPSLPPSTMLTGHKTPMCLLSDLNFERDAAHDLRLCRLWTTFLLQPVPLLQHPAAPQPPASPCWH